MQPNELIARALARKRVSENIWRENEGRSDETFIAGFVDHAWRDFLPDADAVLAAIEASGTHCIVPLEPTRDMLKGYQNGLRRHIEAVPRELRKERWGTRKRHGADCYQIPEYEKAAARYWAMLAARPRDVAPTDREEDHG